MAAWPALLLKCFSLPSSGVHAGFHRPRLELPPCYLTVPTIPSPALFATCPSPPAVSTTSATYCPASVSPSNCFWLNVLLQLAEQKVEFGHSPLARHVTGQGLLLRRILEGSPGAEVGQDHARLGPLAVLGLEKDASAARRSRQSVQWV